MDTFWNEISAQTFSEHASIQVYQTNYQAAKLAAIHSHYLLTKKLMGESLFKAISKHFVAAIASVNDSLNFYGKEFPDFLKEITPHNARLQDKRYLVDIAKLDWAISQSYFAPDDDINISWQTQEPTERSYLLLAKHTFFVSLQSLGPSKIVLDEHLDPLSSVSSQLFSDLLIEKINHSNTITKDDAFSYIDRDNESINLLVFRSEFEVRIMELSESERMLYLLFRERTPLFLVEEQNKTLTDTFLIIKKFKDAGILIGISEQENAQL